MKIENVRIALDLSCGHTIYAHRDRRDLLDSKGNDITDCERCRVVKGGQFVVTEEVLHEVAESGRMLNPGWALAFIARIRQLEDAAATYPKEAL